MSGFSEVESSIASYRRGLREGAVSGEGYSDKMDYKRKHYEHTDSDGDVGHNGDDTVLYQDSQLHDGLIDIDLVAKLELALGLLREDGVDLLSHHNGALQHQNGESPLHLDDLLEIGVGLEIAIDLLREKGVGLLNHHGAEQHQNAETPLHLDNIVDIDADVGVDLLSV
ncbi:hypothetical protein CCR75_008263 [Bremia lactucae]|uniref:Uncharacterized protein n=1 Tax=Bremia lactucae TaxID=4779 RepID=A0A976NZV1_BRELC|nr:hypothetical protein CCR75_008263 [Bremia lactucae]